MIDFSKETYLGDGLYVSLEGDYMIKLRAPREDGDHWVGLEPPTFLSLMEWVTALRTARARTKGETFVG